MYGMAAGLLVLSIIGINFAFSSTMALAAQIQPVYRYTKIPDVQANSYTYVTGLATDNSGAVLNVGYGIVIERRCIGRAQFDSAPKTGIDTAGVAQITIMAYKLDSRIVAFEDR
jgi:hypothetical protein